MALVVVFQEIEYGEAVSVAILVPSTMNWTLWTATLSEAEAETVTVPDAVEPALGDVIETVGGVVSGGPPTLFTFTVTGEEVVVFPEVSIATAVSV